MFTVMSLAHQWWLWTQHNWGSWFWKTGRSQSTYLPAWETLDTNTWYAATTFII